MFLANEDDLDFFFLQSALEISTFPEVLRQKKTLLGYSTVKFWPAHAVVLTLKVDMSLLLLSLSPLLGDTCGAEKCKFFAHSNAFL